ncbi:hypothetical protein KP001_09800 [Geomonas subterranea]|uniref:Uncharacterized protein n=1 Tax=Geomonas subterranea TaxID=2847989 RepID=A0ABX8LRA2_9BACT|nr:hypothetical protein [Geomonas subterranea]QXE92783.1 hypothetical protein KP001_09800 [Geomonas subterranea]QXM09113.1 hypothetical protein KP002_19475 [Geomonas subterranea]
MNVKTSQPKYTGSKPLENTISALNKKQIRNLNRRFERGPYLRKTIADYPVLHAYLSKVFREAQKQLLQGVTVKLTLGQPWILAAPNTYQQVDAGFWLERVGAYRIDSCDASTQCLSLKVSIPKKKDGFYPDDFVLQTTQSMCQIYVSDKGKLTYIDLIFNTKPPGFIRELARYFSMGGPSARRKLRNRIKCMEEEPDSTFLSPIKFSRAKAVYI